MKNRRIVALIPARSGSKGVKDKNIRELCGKPLIAYSITEALKSKYIDKVIVSTDSEKIRGIALEFGADAPFLRPAELSCDDTPDMPVIKHSVDFLENNSYRPELIVYLRPTVPLRDADLIDRAVEAFWKSGKAVLKSLTEVGGCFHPYWMFRIDDCGALRPVIPGVDIKKYYRRQLLPPVYRINGVIDIFSRDVVVKGDYDLDDISRFLVSEDISFDIDSETDFKIAEALLCRNYQK